MVTYNDLICRYRMTHDAEMENVIRNQHEYTEDAIRAAEEVLTERGVQIPLASITSPRRSSSIENAPGLSASTKNNEIRKPRISLGKLFLITWSVGTVAGFIGAMASNAEFSIIVFQTFIKGIGNAIAAGIVVMIIGFFRKE